MSDYIRFCLNNDPDAIYTLPLPVSVNERGNKIKYAEWRALAEAALLPQQLHRFEEPIAIIYNIFVPDDDRKRDCANFEKAGTDFLVRSGIIKDDHLVRLNIQQWMDAEPPSEMVDIFIWRLPGLAEL